MKSKLVSLFCCLIMLVSFSGCTKVTQLVKDNQPTKAELLAEINEEHQRWEAAPAADPTPYLRHYDDPADAQKYFDYVTDTYSEYNAAKELSLEEAEEDVNYLFDAFYYDFAFYDYFGGHTVGKSRDFTRASSKRQPDLQRLTGDFGETPHLYQGRPFQYQSQLPGGKGDPLLFPAGDVR